MSIYRLLASVYEHYAHPELYKIYLQLIEKHTTPCQTLEAGCGTAYLSRKLAKKGYQVTAIDSEPAMLEAASYHVGEEQVEVTLRQHDLREPFTESYELILMPYDIINHFHEPLEMQTVLTQINQVLKQDGILILDYLHEETLIKLDGYEEIINTSEKEIQWTIKTNTKHLCTHYFTAGDVTLSQSVRAYTTSEILKRLPHFEIIDTAYLDDRTLQVLRKRKTNTPLL